MTGIIDFHSHILPALDDGSASVPESIAMLQMAAQQGIGHVVATPHFYAAHEKLEDFLEKRRKAETVLRAAMETADGLPQLTIGAEVYYFRGISESEWLQKLTFRGKQCILIEMPPAPWSDFMYRELEDIWYKRGIIPIIAHLDRYIAPFRTHKIPERLARMPVLVQANASFFLKRSTRMMALRLLGRGQIHLLGSDCHNLTSRPPNLGGAVTVVEQHFGQQICSQLQVWQARIFPE